MTEAELAEMERDLAALRAGCRGAEFEEREAARFEERFYGTLSAALMVGTLVFGMILTIIPGGWAQFFAILSAAMCPAGAHNFGC